jgi:hypothetical protein
MQSRQFSAAGNFGLRWQAERDTAFLREPVNHRTMPLCAKAPSPLRSAGADLTDPTQFFTRRDRLPWFWFFFTVAVLLLSAIDRLPNYALNFCAWRFIPLRSHP